MLCLLFTLCFFAISLAEEVCHPPCGCFNDDPPFDDRPLPESWDSSGIDLFWELYTRGNDPVTIQMDDSISAPPEFDSSKDTVVLIHGWNSSPASDNWQDVRDSYLDLGDYNVIVTDWSGGADSVLYPESASNTQVVGACTNFMMEEIGADLGSTQCVGHSLGGQTCGYFGKASGSALYRITALDPAGPLFDEKDDTVRLDKADCGFMDILHTSAGDLTTDLGMATEVGDVDFFPNNGHQQPGCGNNPNCDHGAGFEFLINSMSDPEFYEANPCDSDQDAEDGLCDSCSGNECQYMGQFSIDYSGRGRYYLDLGSRRKNKDH